MSRERSTSEAACKRREQREKGRTHDSHRLWLKKKTTGRLEDILGWADGEFQSIGEAIDYAVGVAYANELNLKQVIADKRKKLSRDDKNCNRSYSEIRDPLVILEHEQQNAPCEPEDKTDDEIQHPEGEAAKVQDRTES